MNFNLLGQLDAVHRDTRHTRIGGMKGHWPSNRRPAVKNDQQERTDEIDHFAEESCGYGKKVGLMASISIGATTLIMNVISPSVECGTVSICSDGLEVLRYPILFRSTSFPLGSITFIFTWSRVVRGPHVRKKPDEAGPVRLCSTH